MDKRELLFKLKDAPGYVISYANIDKIVNKDFVKKLRKDLDMSQSVFAAVLGVTKKTIEKWEQGVNPIKGCSARLLYLIYNNKNIIKDLYNVNAVNVNMEAPVYFVSNEQSDISSEQNDNFKLNTTFVENKYFTSNSKYKKIDNNQDYWC